MAFLQTDIDPLFLREKHLKHSKTCNNFALDENMTTETESSSSQSKRDLSFMKRLFLTKAASTEMADQARPLLNTENLDRLVSYYRL